MSSVAEIAAAKTAVPFHRIGSSGSLARLSVGVESGCRCFITTCVVIIFLSTFGGSGEPFVMGQRAFTGSAPLPERRSSGERTSRSDP